MQRILNKCLLEKIEYVRIFRIAPQIDEENINVDHKLYHNIFNHISFVEYTCVI